MTIPAFDSALGSTTARARTALTEELRARARTAGRDRSRDSDVSLIRDVEDRQNGALAEVYERHGVHLHVLARRYVPEQAGDVVQEVLLRLWQRPDRFDPGRGSLRAYLRMAVRGRSVDVIRSEVARRNREDAVEEGQQRSPYRDCHVAAGRSDHEVWELLILLPRRESDPIALAYLFGFTYREAAVSLGLPEGTVKTRVRSGLGRLRPLLSDDLAATSR